MNLKTQILQKDFKLFNIFSRQMIDYELIFYELSK